MATTSPPGIGSRSLVGQGAAQQRVAADKGRLALVHTLLSADSPAASGFGLRGAREGRPLAAEAQCWADAIGGLLRLEAIAASILSAACALSPARAMEARLIPLHRDFSETKSMAPFFLATQRLLLPSCQTGVLVFPSFHSEWSLCVDGSGQEAIVTLAEVERPIYVVGDETAATTRQSPDQVYAGLMVGVRRTQRPLSSATLKAITGAWSASVAAAAMPPEPTRSIDGVGYVFISADAPLLGMTWAAQQDTPAGALVAVVDALRHHVEGAPDSESLVIARVAEVGRLLDRPQSKAPPNKRLKLTRGREDH